MRQAFKFWQDKADIDFQELPDNDDSEPDIVVKFVEFYHQDPYPFDGPGGIMICTTAMSSEDQTADWLQVT